MSSAPDLVELRTTGIAAGGEAVARESSGRVVFVRGALPGETVMAQLVEQRGRHARAVVHEVRAASPARIEAPCPYVAAGCGGCSWQHVAPDEQRRLKRQIVIDALRRIGRVAEPHVLDGPDLATEGFRTTLRMAVDADGRLGYRKARSHEVIAVGRCLIAHPRLADVIAGARFPGAREVVLRCSATTGERLAVVEPPGPARLDLDDVDLRPGAAVHEEIAGRRLRVSARSFFQSRADGAAALVELVREAAGPQLGADVVVDAYAGVGLFGACLPVSGRVVAIETSASSCADAASNLAHRAATVLRRDVARWRPEPAGLVVADPPRAGLGRLAAARLASTGAPAIVLVSCDPVAMARDVGLLRDHGYLLTRAALVDLFPHTPHVEAVARLERAGA